MNASGWMISSHGTRIASVCEQDRRNRGDRMNRHSIRILAARRDVLALAIVLLGALLFLPWLGFTDLMHEETRRAVIARTMMESGNYLVPYLAEQIYLSKPPLFNWLIALVSAPGGEVTEFTARLPSVLSLIAIALLMVFTVGRYLYMPARWLLGLGVLVTGELMHKSVLGTMDATFTLFVSASLWTWFMLDERRRRGSAHPPAATADTHAAANGGWKGGLALWLPPAILVAAAFLTKREPALVFYYFGIGAFLLTQRRFLELFRPPHLLAATVTFALIALWLGPVVYLAGLDEVLANLQQQVISRGISPEFRDYVEHFLRYPIEIFVAALPTSPLLLALAWPSVRRAVHARHGRLFVFAVVVVLINLPVYWLRADAAVRYFLPMFPTMVVVAALVFDTLVAQVREWPASARRTQYGLALFLLGVTATFAVAIIVLSIPGVFPAVPGPIMPWPLMGLIGLAGLVALGWILLRRSRDVAMVVFVAMIGFGIGLRAIEIGFRIPHEAQRIVEENDDMPAILARIRNELPAGINRVQAVGTMPHAVWFYDRQGLVVPMARYDREGKPASPYLLLWAEKRTRANLPGIETEAVARVPYEDEDFILLRARPAPTSE